MKTQSLIERVAKRVAPPPPLKVSEWADCNRFLSQEASAEPGRWRTSRAEYQRGIMDAFCEPGIQRVVGMMSAQVGKSEILLNVAAYHIDQDPAPMLIVQPTLDLAEAFSKDRLAPMIRDTPSVGLKVQDVKSKTGGNTLLHKKFPGGHVTLAGANSPASLASRPIRIVLCDEVDRYPFSAGTEGDPVKLAEKRATTFFNYIYGLFSTPTIENYSRIALAYENSDKRKFQVPCPLCQEFQPLSFSSIKWDRDRDLPTNVRYQCAHCSGEFDDSHKPEIISRGKWIAENPWNGTAGFHLSELYSPWVRWSKTVQAFLEAKKDPNQLKVWVNTALGETWKDKGEAPEWERIYHMREDYPLRVVPAGGAFLTAGADVQKDRIEVEIVAWGRGKESWSIDYMVIPGDTSTDVPWNELDKLLLEYFPKALDPNVSIPIRVLAIDSGFNTQRVYTWARRHPQTRVIVVKGKDSLQMVLGEPTAVDVNFTGKRIRRGVKLWHVGVNTVKSELYAWLRLNKPTSDIEPYPSGYCHFPQYGEEFFKMLTAEQIVMRTVRGYTIHEWVKKRERNEALDCRVYARAAAALAGLDRFSASKWDETDPESARIKKGLPKLESVPAITSSPNSPALPKSQAVPKKKSSYWDR